MSRPEVDPERYELDSPPLHRFDLTRRDVFRLLGGGLAVGFLLDDARAQESGGGRRPGFGPEPTREIGAWLHIGEEGAVTVFTGKVEVGQDIRTSLSQAVAEELRVPLASVRLVMGDTDRVPFDMGTFGSLSTPMMGSQLRRVAAGARELLIDLAAREWKTDRAALMVSEGRVWQKGSSTSLPFGQLVRGRKLVETLGDNTTTAPPAEWQVAGKSVPKVDGREFVTGGHRYTSDLKLPGMLHGKVLRPPAIGSTLTSVDLDPARAIPGVVAVHDGDFVGVAAPDPETATRALGAIHAEWTPGPPVSARGLFQYLKENPVEAQGFEGRGRHQAGSVEEGLAAADLKLEQSYTVAYIAHAPLEPRAAVAEWTEGKVTVWTGTQRPFGVKSGLAEAFRIPEERVRVIVPDTGSAYGGKHTGEAAIEAARLARAAGKPVKLVWTREEEFSWAYFRPAGLIEVKSGARRDGTLTAWEFHNYNSGASAIRTLYEIPHQRIEFHAARSPLRQGSYRALAATANHFARETHMDELARALSMDPLEFRLRNLKDARLRAALEKAAAAFGWGRKPPAHHGVGLAGGFEKGGYVAACAEVAVDRESQQVRIERVVTAFDCGAVVNPDHLRSQIEGAMVMGIGGALFEGIDFDQGKILNPRFTSYRVPRFSDLPILETVLIDRRDVPSAGAGETPIVALAPAVGNAIFAATGVRLRALPLAPNGLKSASE